MRLFLICFYLLPILFRMRRYIVLICTERTEANLLKRSHWRKLLYRWYVLNWLFVVWRSIRFHWLVSFRVCLLKNLIIWTLFLNTLLIVDFVYLVFLGRCAVLSRSLFIQVLKRLRGIYLIVIIIRCPIFQKVFIIRSTACCWRLGRILYLTVFLWCKWSLQNFSCWFILNFLNINLTLFGFKIDMCLGYIFSCLCICIYAV
jgi:hypothetical protein